MKSKILQRGAFVLAAALLLTGVAAFTVPEKITASANSAPRYWRGTSSSGVIFTGENCPLQVEKEVLTFNLNDFPPLYGTADEFLAYTGSVTAEYTFKNPTENSVEATLAFPFGRLPNYAVSYDEEGNRVNDIDMDKYTVKTDGEDASPTLRHTYYDGDDFNFDRDAARMRDDFTDDDFYKIDLPVYKYTFTASAQTDEIFFSVATIPLDKTKTRIAAYDYTNEYTDGGIKITWRHETSDITTFFVVGDDIDATAIKWKFYYEEWKKVPILGSQWKKKSIEGSASASFQEQTTFKDFALKDREEGCAISEVDYYNGAVDYLNDYSSRVLIPTFGRAFERNVMRWYEYDLTLSAGQSVVNAVTVPTYPTIDGGYSSYVYEYEYYLSPAAKWADFGEIEIAVNTPFYIVKGGSKFEKVDGGYKYTASGLPSGELEFSLCESENPEYIETSYTKVFKVVFAVIIVVGVLFACAVLGVIIWAIVYACKKK